MVMILTFTMIKRLKRSKVMMMMVLMLVMMMKTRMVKAMMLNLKKTRKPKKAALLIVTRKCQNLILVRKTIISVKTHKEVQAPTLVRTLISDFMLYYAIQCF